MNAAPDSLNLPGLRVLARHETDGQYLFHVEAKVSLPGPCCLLHDHVKNGTKEQRFRDFPMHGKFVQVAILRQRFLCRQCKATTYEDVTSLDDERRMSARFVEAITRRASSKSFTDVAQLSGISEGTVRSIFADHMQNKLADYSFPTPEVLGMDEKHLNGQYRFILGDVGSRHLLDMLPTREKADVAAYFETLADRGNVRVISQDMYKNYRALANRYFPRAEIVVDKFHVIQLANLAVEEARRRNVGSLSPTEQRIIKQQRSLFEQRFHTLSQHDQDRVQAWLVRLPRFAEAYRIKEDLIEIYRCATKGEAIQHHRTWTASLQQDTGEYFKRVSTAFDNWGAQIFSYWEHPYTNAYIESVNNLIGHFERTGRGYSFPVLRAKAILSYGIFREPIPTFQKIDLPASFRTIANRRPRRVRGSGTVEFITVSSTPPADVRGTSWAVPRFASTLTKRLAGLVDNR